MSKQYSCELCKKVFNRKNDLTKHTKNKTPCIPLTEIQQANQTNEVKIYIKASLINVFKSCLNILRDNGLTGEKALRNMSYLLILKLLEPRFGDEIDIDNYGYDFSHINDDTIETHKNKLLKIARFSNLSKEKEDDIPTLMKYLWDDILSVHPTTKGIFLKDRGFDIQHQSTFKKLIDKLNSLDLSQTEYDVLGNAYEEVIQDIMTGKVLGQFFTQPLVKKMMVKLIDPQIHANGKIDTCGDPTMGTGGFLITYLQYILQQAKDKNIKPDWDFIKTEGLYGKELDPDTYQLAVSNMLISSGHMFGGLENDDSIRKPITRKFDNILTRIKGLKYDDFQYSLKSEYVPIKTDNAVSLFIQAIIYMLNINGKCAVVLPDGQDLFSKTNTSLIAIREYLMKTCDLKEIIYLPSGIFTYTTIKTCVFYFVKKIEGTDILKTEIKLSKKTKKEIGREYIFSKTHQTTTVKFYNYDFNGDVKNLLVEVPIEKFASNSYSLNYAEYMKDETKEEQYEDGVVVKTLGEVCEFQNGSQLDKKDMLEGNIPIFGGGVKIVGFHNSHNRNGNEIIICGTGYPGYVNYSFGKPFWASQCFTMKSKNTSILIDKYVYYYSKIVLEKEFMSKQKGTAQKFIRFNQITDIKIPVPSLERQKEIVKYLDFIYEKANKTSNDKIAELKQLNGFCLNNQKLFGENVVKELGDVFKEVKTGKDVVATERKKGEYPFYGANGIIDYVDSYIFDGKFLLTARTGSLGSLHISNGKFWCSGDVHRMEFENDTLLSYTYYYLQTIDFQKFRTGSAHPKLSGSSLKSIKIPIPSLERQKEIVEYCEYNDILIKQLEKEIENNKKQAQQFISGIVKKQVQKEQDETSTVNSELIDEVQDEIALIEDVIIEPKPKVKKIVKKVKKSNVIAENN